MASEEIILDGNSVCTIVRAMDTHTRITLHFQVNPTEVRSADSAPKGKTVGTVDRQFCFRVFAASAKGKTKVPARTRVCTSFVVSTCACWLILPLQYFSGQSAEERDAWIIAICNNIALYNPKYRSGV